MERRVDWTVIDHVPGGVASSTDLKVAYLVRVSPSVTEITLGLQTMMCSMTRRGFPTSGTGVQGAGESVVTKIRAAVTLDVRRVWTSVLDKDSRGGGGDPLSISDLNADDFVVSY